jgi:hypothetical protein
MHRVELSTHDWHASAYLARSFADRLLGSFRAPRGAVVALRARSVHSFGQRAAMELVVIGAGMTVVATRTLEPNRITIHPTASLIVELPGGSPVPSVGDRVEVTLV